MLLGGRVRQRGRGHAAQNTLSLQLAALSRWHRYKRLPSPRDNEAVRAVLQCKKGALDASRIVVLLAFCNGSLQGIGDRALRAFGFATGRRRRS